MSLRSYSESRIKKPSSPDACRRRVLIIDDEQPFAAAVAEFFTDRGYEAHFVDSVRAAMKEMKIFDPDVVVADIRMPEASGLDLLEVLRSAGDRRVIIIVSAYGDMHQVWRALHFDADGFLRKPVDLEQLARLVDAAISRKEKQSSIHHQSQAAPHADGF